MQPIGTKKILSFATKKSRNVLGQKKLRNLSGQKNHATSQDKKIPQPLGTKKNHTTSRDKKLCNLPGPKKIRNLSGQLKICILLNKKLMQPLETKKITLSIGPITSKLVLISPYKAPNCSKWHQICPNGSKLVQTFPKGTKWVQMGSNVSIGVQNRVQNRGPKLS